MKKLITILSIFTLFSCVSLPEETVDLSRQIHTDIKELQRANVHLVNLYFNRLEKKADDLIENQYIPFVIQFVLKAEQEAFEDDEESIFKDLLMASQDQNYTNQARESVENFYLAMENNISSKRKELQQPIEEKKAKFLADINQAYAEVLQSNLILTDYLKSARRLKNANESLLNQLQLSGYTEKISNELINYSSEVEQILDVLNKADDKSEKGIEALEKAIEQIQKL